MITHVIVELKYPVEDEYFHMDTVFPNEYYGYGTPLIRCRNCENHREPVNMCDIWHRHTNGEGYCHRAKAKSKEQKAKCKGGEEG